MLLCLNERTNQELQMISSLSCEDCSSVFACYGKGGNAGRCCPLKWREGGTKTLSAMGKMQQMEKSIFEVIQ